VEIHVKIFGRRAVIVRLATRALKALRASSIALRPRCARLAALTARAATRVLATIDGHNGCATTEVLDDGRCRRYCLIIFAGCSSQPPPHRPMWSTFESAVSGHGSFSNSQIASRLSVRATSRSRNRRPNRIASRPQARCRSGRRTVRRNHHAVTAVRLSEVDASGDALSAPIHCEQQRHRRSEWAGVSWPKDDDDERDAAGDGALARRRRTTDVPTTSQTLHFVRSSARWRARPHASASSRN
jgi:hypothetical protein